MESLSLITENISQRRKVEIMSEDHTCLVYGLNEFSDDILINILSHLTLKEAVRTSILSRRWRYLWKRFTGCLNFDNLVRIPVSKFERGGGFDVEKQKFVSLVNQVLGSLQAQTVEELRIRFDVRSHDDIHNWIKFAAEKKIQKLELDLDFCIIWGPCNVHFTFPPYIVSHSGFRSLTSLRLRRVDITGEVLEHFLTYCTLLEVLSVSRSRCLKKLKVSGSSLKLRYLKLEYIRDLEIQAPNLLSLELGSSELPFTFDVPNLSELSFCGHYIIRNICSLSSFLVRLRRLKLNLRAIQQLTRLPDLPLNYNIPELYNLKHLEMDIFFPHDIYFLACVAFLNAATSLDKFTLRLNHLSPMVESAQSNKDRLYSILSELISIREFEVVGFRGRDADTDFVTYVIENARRLEKVTIDPCGPIYVGSPQEPFLRECEDYQTRRRQARQLAASLPLLEFIIL